MSESLYGIRNPTKAKPKPISSSVSFASNLSSLIASSKSRSTTSTEPHSTSKAKSDIFTTHNRNISKRKHADLSQDHKTKHDVGTTSTADLHLSKRKMEEKSRLYAAMKRGEYIPHSTTSHHDTSLVDFDRKWAESQPNNDQDTHDSAESDNNSSSSDTQEQVKWTDEFGRLRHGTQKEHLRHQRTQQAQQAAQHDTSESSARPTRPSNIIQGDTIQSQAFNPDHAIQTAMNDLAAKRDKEATPPPDTYFDANWEIRDRGTGFYKFSGDSEMRREEMEALERERRETERVRGEKEGSGKGMMEEGKERRKREMEERRRKIDEKRREREMDRRDREADKFLEELDVDAVGAGEEGGEAG